MDGQTATAALVETLTALNATVSYRLPLRAEEGYGIRPESLAAILDTPDHPELLLTCDVGATAFAALEVARSRGVAIIVTDHHRLASDLNGAARLPPADAFVSPRLLGNDSHPLASLPGVGAAYKLIEALATAMGRPELAENILDLAALGIVADVAEITGETRRLLQWGLRRLRQNLRPGLSAVYERANLDPSLLTETQIGFEIVPRLNAIGRLADANPAVELLITHDPGRARLLAVQLEGLNARRRLLTAEVYRSARSQIEHDPALQRAPLLTVYHPDWEPGVIGIAAARISERFGRPALLAAAPVGGMARGSARSIPGYDITAALAEEAHLLTTFGGHAYAAGFSLPSADLPRLRLALEHAAANSRTLLSLVDKNQVKGEGFEAAIQIEWGAISPELAAELERLGPFGPGNPTPAFRSSGLRLASATTRGRERQHLALTLEDSEGLTRRVTWWGGSEQFEDPSDAFPHGSFELLYAIRLAPPNRAGQRSIGEQIDLEYIAHRITSEPSPQAPRLNVEDCRRRVDHPLPALISWLKAGATSDPRQPQDVLSAGEATLIYAEGPARDQVAAALSARGIQTPVVDRMGIRSCAMLVMWTAPPSPGVLTGLLNHALGDQELKFPLRVVFFGLDPGLDATRPFLERLIGLARWAVNRQNGEVETERLAAALASTPMAARAGIAALVERGILRSTEVEGGLLRLEWQPSNAQLPVGEAAARLNSILDESRAFRRHLNRQEPIGLERFI